MNEQLNILSVDLEEWFVVEILRDRFPQETWPKLQSTLARSCRSLLDLFAEYNVKATWFVLGWCAERHPRVIEEIAAQGHEIGNHSFWHRRVDSMDPAAFREDTLRATEAIQRACNLTPKGFRAPSWSIAESNSWAFDILAELGFTYDSSIFPIKHDLYGMPAGPRDYFKMDCREGRTLFEIPASTYRVLGRNIPIAGGGYLRHQPYWYTRRLLRRVNQEGRPAVVYIHPWEIDTELPKIPELSPLQWFRTYGSTQVMIYKLQRLLQDFRFVTVGEFLKEQTRRPIGFH